jgi:hypothetical protein
MDSKVDTPMEHKDLLLHTMAILHSREPMGIRNRRRRSNSNLARLNRELIQLLLVGIIVVITGILVVVVAATLASIGGNSLKAGNSEGAGECQEQPQKYYLKRRSLVGIK